MKRIDITGQTYGNLYVIDGYSSVCTCKCNCGKIINVRKGNLRSGHSQSCGCLRDKACSNNFTTHGATGSRLHNIWRDIKKRCFNEKYKQFYLYGGRGITICSEWLDYVNFANWSLTHGYADDLTIERINVNGNYEPTNCTWIPSQLQARNKRTNHFVEFDGRRLTIAEWSEQTGISQGTIWYRLSHGWTAEEALTIPVLNGATNEQNFSKLPQT